MGFEECIGNEIIFVNENQKLKPNQFVGIGDTKDEAVTSSELVQTVTDKLSSFMTTEKMLGIVSKSRGIETEFYLKVEDLKSSCDNGLCIFKPQPILTT